MKSAILGGALLLLGSVEAAVTLKISGNLPTISGWMRASHSDPNLQAKINTVNEALDYFKRLGYTHVFYPMENPYAPIFSRATGQWIYNGGSYAAGDHAESFRAMKTAIEQRGMRMIPMVKSLSHLSIEIGLDPSISEISNWSAFCLANAIPCESINNHVASTLNNPGATQFFREYLRIINANWGSTAVGGARPAYIHIGHDEIGYGRTCYIKADKTKNSTSSRSKLVADEIGARIAQINTEVGSSTKVMVFGDSFLPGDYGDTYGMAGSSTDGTGGVLQLLKATQATRLIVQPWMYSTLEYAPVDPGRGLVVSKVRQVERLDKLGYSYVPYTGEDEAAPVFIDQWSTINCLFEWVRISQMYPSRLLGFSHMSYNPWTATSPGNLRSGYTAPALAYFAWTFGERSLKLARHNTFSARMTSKVDYVRSRNELAWTEQNHYSRPPLMGILEMRRN